MKLVYVAGPYRAKTVWRITRNIERARELGLRVALLGAVPVVPHANTALYDGELPDQFWLDGTLELMRRCDAVVLTSEWHESQGARGELKEARRLRIPVFPGISWLQHWIETGAERTGCDCGGARVVDRYDSSGGFWDACPACATTETTP